MSEVLTQRENIGLTDEDQSWLAGFGVDPTWQDDPKARNHLNDLIELGSMRLDEPINHVNRSAIIDARTMFMHFVGVEQDTLDVFLHQNPTIIPLDTFTATQRTIFELGLDAVKIINTFPGTIKFAPESVREKVRFLNRSIDVLRWEHTAVELINFYPALLSFSTKKLAVLRRIAGTHINEASRSAEPKVVASALIVPLEKYILELSKAGDTDLYEQTAIIPSVEELAKTAKRHNLNAVNRREQALQAVMDGSDLGKIATMYLAYRKISSF